MVEFERLEQEELKELEKLERLEHLEGAVLEEVEVNNQKRGGVRMFRQRRKRNIEKMLERLKRLQRSIKESQKMYYIELGKAALIWYQEYKQGGVGIEDLEKRLREVADMFGKDLNEPVE
jgi:hypothetical protein